MLRVPLRVTGPTVEGNSSAGTTCPFATDDGSSDLTDPVGFTLTRVGDTSFTMQV